MTSAIQPWAKMESQVKLRSDSKMPPTTVVYTAEVIPHGAVLQGDNNLDMTNPPFRSSAHSTLYPPPYSERQAHRFSYPPLNADYPPRSNEQRNKNTHPSGYDLNICQNGTWSGYGDTAYTAHMKHENAPIIDQYDEPPPNEAQQAAVKPKPKAESYLLLSLIVTVCFNCPIGILSIIMSVEARKAFKREDKIKGKCMARCSLINSMFAIAVTLAAISAVVLHVAYQKRQP